MQRRRCLQACTSLHYHLQILLPILVARPVLAARQLGSNILLPPPVARTQKPAGQPARQYRAYQFSPFPGVTLLLLGQLYAISCSTQDREVHLERRRWLYSAGAEMLLVHMLYTQQAVTAPRLFEVDTRIPECYCTRCMTQQSAVLLTLLHLLILQRSLLEPSSFEEGVSRRGR